MSTISVIIPVYNDSEGIGQTLQSVVQQTHPSYEIVPVDNDSTDETPAVISKWRKQYPALIRPTAERSVQSSYAARNTGIEHARGDVLAFIDADMTVPEGWLQAITSHFADTETDYLGYDIQVYVPEGEKGIWGWYDQIMGLPSQYHYENNQFVPTSCLAVRKETIEKVGEFDERLRSGGDKEFGERVHNHPTLSTKFSDDIVAYHPARTTFKEHREKAIRIGRGMGQLYKQSIQKSSSISLFLELTSHLFPPSPFRIYRRCNSPLEYIFIYVMDTVIRYFRLYGIFSYFISLR